VARHPGIDGPSKIARNPDRVARLILKRSLTQGVALGYHISRRWREDRMKRQTLQEWAGVSRIFALVFTDIVDSTSLAVQLGDESWIELLRKHFAQVRRLLAQYEHHEIKIIGDSFMVIFRTALDAFDFGLALEKDTGDSRIRIRVGIHVGSARVIDDDIFGNMVNYTKRVEGVQLEGGITLSDVAYREITNEKAARHSWLVFQSLQVPFKGLPNQELVWLVITPANAARLLGNALRTRLPNSKLG